MLGLQLLTKKLYSSMMFFFIDMLMKTTSIKTLYHSYETLIGQELLVKGWIRSLRDSKTFGLLNSMMVHISRIYKLFLNLVYKILTEICKFPTGVVLKFVENWFIQRQNRPLNSKL